MKITAKKEGVSPYSPGSSKSPTVLWRVYLGGRPSMRHWDLSNETDHVMSAHSKSVLIRRLKVLVSALQEA